MEGSGSISCIAQTDQEPSSLHEGAGSRTDGTKNGMGGTKIDGDTGPLRQENGRDEKTQENVVEEVEWDEDGDETVNEDDRLALSLVGKLWSYRVPNPNAFISTMKGVWLVKYGVEISNVGKNLYQIQLFHWRDKKRILDG